MGIGHVVFDARGEQPGQEERRLPSTLEHDKRYAQ